MKISNSYYTTSSVDSYDMSSIKNKNQSFRHKQLNFNYKSSIENKNHKNLFENTYHSSTSFVFQFLVINAESYCDLNHLLMGQKKLLKKIGLEQSHLLAEMSITKDKIQNIKNRFFNCRRESRMNPLCLLNIHGKQVTSLMTLNLLYDNQKKQLESFEISSKQVQKQLQTICNELTDTEEKINSIIKSKMEQMSVKKLLSS